MVMTHACRQAPQARAAWGGIAHLARPDPVHDHGVDERALPQRVQQVPARPPVFERSCLAPAETMHS
jgi:hypothetical protein